MLCSNVNQNCQAGWIFIKWMIYYIKWHIFSEISDTNSGDTQTSNTMPTHLIVPLADHIANLTMVPQTFLLVINCVDMVNLANSDNQSDSPSVNVSLFLCGNDT